MTVSFRMVRNLGMSAVIALITVIGAFSFVGSAKVVRSLSAILEIKAPLLEKLDSIRQDFWDARDAVIAFS
ncbi:MAG: hypothetical protein PHT59_06355, partial [Candidatus Omnitrophica bacterium]|nr:hypothetical protein [Candidatus Omnitrophota bacterium]